MGTRLVESGEHLVIAPQFVARLVRIVNRPLTHDCYIAFCILSSVFLHFLKMPQGLFIEKHCLLLFFNVLFLTAVLFLSQNPSYFLQQVSYFALAKGKNRIFRHNKRDFLQENLPAHRLCATKRIAKQSVLQRMRTLPCPNKRRHRKKPQAFSCATVLWGRKGTTCLLSGACCGQPRSRPCGLRGDHGGQQPDPRDFPCPLPRCRQGRRRRRRVSACFPFPWVQA